MPSGRLLLILSLVFWHAGLVAGHANDRPQLKPKLELSGFPDWVTSVAISPDGALLAAGSYDVVRLVPLSGGPPVAELPTRCGFAQALQFTPDRTRLLVGGYQQVQIWDVSTRQRVATLKGHKGYVRALALSPDGTQLATASEDATARIWNLSDHQTAHTLGPFELPVLGISWSPDGAWLATAAGDESRLTKPGVVQLWNARTGELAKVLPAPEKAATAVAFSPDGTRLLATGVDEHVNVYDVAAGTALGFFGGHSRPTNCVLFAGRNDIAISGSGGRFKGLNEIKVFQIADGEELGTIEHQAGKITALALAHDGRTLASASYDKTVAVWDLSPFLPTATSAPAAATTTLAAAPETQTPEQKLMRIGIIGLDTSHAVAFTKVLNAENPQPAVSGCRVVAAYPQGSPDIKSSVDRVPEYTAQVEKLGVEIVPTIDALLEKVDFVLLETNDGRPHLEQVLPVLKARKPVFVDKPIAASLEDAIAIIEAARFYQTPVFSASSLRFLGQAAEVRRGDFGPVLGCDAYSPCALEATHPDLYWYGIHGVEALFTVMGPGIESVSRASTTDFELVTGVWEGGRIGTFRGLRAGARGYGGTAFCDKKTITLGPYPGYQPLVESIVHFFRTGEAPVTSEETLAIYAFMSAADASRDQGGAAVPVAPLVKAAREAAHKKLATLIPDYKAE